MLSAVKRKDQSAGRPNIRSGQSTNLTLPKISCQVSEIRITLQPVDSKRNSKRKLKSKLVDTTFFKKIWAKLKNSMILYQRTALFALMNLKFCQCWKMKDLSKKVIGNCQMLIFIFPTAFTAVTEAISCRKGTALIKIKLSSYRKIQVKWIKLCSQIISVQVILLSIKVKTSIQFLSTILQTINFWKFHKYWRRKR